MAKKDEIYITKKEFSSFKESVNANFRKIIPKVNVMHEFIIRDEGFKAGQASIPREKDGSININKDVWGIIWKLILAILALAGINKLTSP